MTATLAPPDPRPVPPDETMADLLDRLGGILPLRVRLVPTPGTATEADAIAAEARFGRLCELVDGTLVEKPAGLYESVLAGIMLQLIGAFVRPRRLGIVAGEQGMMRVQPGRLRMPDVSFTSWARLPATYPADPAPRVSPDLAVEVLSPSNTTAEMDRKRAEYLAGGTRLVWVVDPPTQTVAVYTPAAAEPAVYGVGDTVDGGDVLSGFTMSVADLFAEAARPPAG